MQRLPLILAIALLSPASAVAAQAATFSVGQSLVVASSSPENAYVAGATAVIAAPVAGDLTALGGSIVIAAPVAGDELLLGGSVHSRAYVSGDVRVAGASIEISEQVAGDLTAVGLSVTDSGRVAGNLFVIAGNATVDNGARGPVTIYANNVALKGDFAGDVAIVSSGHISLAPGTTIHGTLTYQSPEPASIPDSARILGSVTYQSVSYLPDAETSRFLLLASIGFFLIARILGALILAGLFAGLFPDFAKRLITKAWTARRRSLLLSFFLGFAIVVATPVVIGLLVLTFVGVGLAMLLLILYLLLLLVALVYAGILLGGSLARKLLKREAVRWHDGVIGMAVLSLVALVPVVGMLLVLILILFVAGLLLQTLYHFLFPHEPSVS